MNHVKRVHPFRRVLKPMTSAKCAIPAQVRGLPTIGRQMALLLGVFVWIAAPVIGTADVPAEVPVLGFWYYGFSTADDLVFLNAAHTTSDPVYDTPAELTAAAASLNGTMNYGRPVLLRDAFDTEFTIRVTNPSGVPDGAGQPGGDGLALVIQSQGGGVSGPLVGYIPYSIPNALAIEFDTWQNTNLGDPDGNHVSVQDVGPSPDGLSEFNHNRSLGWATLPVELSDGQPHTFHVSYTPGSLIVDSLESDTVTDEFGGTVTTTSYHEILNLPIDLTNVGGRNLLRSDGTAWIGLAAGTGAAYESHQILDWWFSATDFGGTANQPPYANAQTVTTAEDTAVGITLTGGDPDGNPLTYAVATGPAHGTLSGTAPDLTYTPEANYHGGDSFTFVANDGTVDSAPATVSITVNEWIPGTGDHVWAWGSDLYGQLGNGGTGVFPLPDATQAPAAWAGHAVTGIAAGFYHTVALLDDGTVWAWGRNGNGQLGDGTTGQSVVPVPVQTPAAWAGHKVTGIAAGGLYTVALLDDGTVWAWGDNGNGQLGNGSHVVGGGSEVPVPVLAPPAWAGHTVTAISAGYGHTVALLDDGTVWAWGSNDYGELGDGNAAQPLVSTPVQVSETWAGHKATGIAAGVNHTVALLDDGTVWAWGYNYYGELGNGTTVHSTIPVPVQAPAAWVGHKVTGIGAGGYHTVALLDDGKVWSWGRNDSGELGNGSTGQWVVPAPVQEPGAWAGHTVIRTAAGYRNTMALLDDGTVWTCGYNEFGELGNGSTGQSAVPVPVQAPGAWSGQRVIRLAAGAYHTVVVLGGANLPPVVDNAIPNQSATYGTAFGFSVPANTFSDPDPGQTVTLSASGLPAWLSFDAGTATFSGTPPERGTFSIAVTATDAAVLPLSVSTSFDLVVGKATLTATGDRLHRFYGEENPPLTGTLEGVVSGDNITASYTTFATTTSTVGAWTIIVTLHDPDNRLGNYELFNTNGVLYVDPAPQTITFGDLPASTYGDAPFSVPVGASSGLPVTLTSSVASVATVSGTTLTITGAGTTLLTAYQPGDADYQAATFVQESFTVGKATPVITWAAPSPITSSAPLSATELNATADVAGSFSYSPSTGTLLPRGIHDLTATFTPNDTVNYTSASGTVSLEVLNSAPVAVAQSVATAEDTPLNLTVTADDVDGDPFSVAVVGGPSHGTLSGTAPNLTYHPNYGYNGPDSFTFKVNDGTVDSSPAAVSITVTPVNHAPSAVPLVLQTLEDTALNVNLYGLDDEASGYSQLKVLSGLDGEGHSGRLVVGIDGLIYGTTSSGGLNNLGTVFRMHPDGSAFTVLHHFSSSASDGRQSYSGLVQDSQGVLYGTTWGGGNYLQGTLFKINPDGTGFTVIHHFQPQTDGYNPQSPLLLANDGLIYGTAYVGGANGVGGVYRVERNGANFTVLHAFGSGGQDGRYASAGVTMGSDGLLYGTTRASATGFGGTVYRLNPDGSGFQVLRSFPDDGSEGSWLLSCVAEGPDGVLYGMGWQGGNNDSGVIYQLNRDGSGFSVLHRFGGIGDGSRPYADLLRGSDGWLYGTTAQDNLRHGGIVFRMQPGSPAIQVLYGFQSSGVNGRHPSTPLTEGPGGVLYGTTGNGGPTDTGTIYKLSMQPAVLQTTVLSGPHNGTLSGTAPNLVYTPEANYNGLDSFTFEVSDNLGLHSAPATISILVTPVNDAPTADHQTLTTYDNEPLAITLTGSDVETANLTYRIMDAPTVGTLSGTPPNLTYTPPFPYSGSDRFTFEVEDAEGVVAVAAVDLAILASDRPPVAVLGDDLTLRSGSDCGADYFFDASASYDPDGDPMTYHWRIWDDVGLFYKVPLPLPQSISLWLGNYTVELTVSTTKNGVTLSSTDTQRVTVLPGVPHLAGLSPASADAGGPGLTLTVAGGCFLQGATVLWNGTERLTTWVSENELVAAIPASDLDTGVSVAVATVQVLNADGQVSDALGFSIVETTVGTVEASVALPGETTAASTAPKTDDTAGVAVAVKNSGGDPVTVLAATYDSKPVGETAFRIDNGDYVDVQINGADANDTAAVLFYYPSTITGNKEDKIKLRYFDGANWIPVLSSGGQLPLKDTTDNLDQTVSGGRFTVIFDDTSTPTIMDLAGTVFGMFDSTPQIPRLEGPTDPLPLGAWAPVNVTLAVVGDPAAATLTLDWGDGSVDAWQASGNPAESVEHLYTTPGVFTVTVEVTDETGDTATARLQYVVVYDPNGGYVTGGGWVWSPEGAFHPDLAELAGVTGKASFGFVARYRKGANTPDGNTEFQFKAGDLNFKSTVYQWLVVAGSRAQYKGAGTINGEGTYGFMLTAIDGQLSGPTQPDRFRMKIWETASGTVIYDNQSGTSDGSELDDTTVLGGGSIVIHKSN
ncbi:MAG: tandem-95 repeat protein [Verrucomicrobiales bacterium]|nr:tandem-95 repeat protein [Verrucomicrobiales bacterium]